MKTNSLTTLFNARRTFFLTRWTHAVPILLGLLLLRSAPDARATSYIFTIPSTTAWTDTGLDVAAGSELQITASGTVQYGPSFLQVTDANGGDYTGQILFPDAMLPNTVVVSLIGKIGGTVANGTGVPIPEGVPGKGIGFVGTAYDQLVPTTGRLFLGFNDRDGFFGDNSGSFSVNVTVVPEPSSAALLAVGGLALFIRRRNRAVTVPLIRQP